MKFKMEAFIILQNIIDQLIAYSIEMRELSNFFH